MNPEMINDEGPDRIVQFAAWTAVAIMLVGMVAFPLAGAHYRNSLKEQASTGMLRADDNQQGLHHRAVMRHGDAPYARLMPRIAR